MSKQDDNDNLFKKVMDNVPAITQDKIEPYRKPRKPIPEQRYADEERVLQELLSASDESTSFYSGDELTYLSDGYPNRLLKRLRNNEYSMQDELDLHGLVASEAKEEVHRFINDCASDKLRAVRIVHGKGQHSPNKKPVLKNLILGWLIKNKHVVAVSSATHRDGGTGAVYILLD